MIEIERRGHVAKAGGELLDRDSVKFKVIWYGFDIAVVSRDGVQACEDLVDLDLPKRKRPPRFKR